MLFHTHPSGDPKPSAEDIAFTRRLHTAAKTVGLEIADHVICGSAERYLSMRKAGLMG